MRRNREIGWLLAAALVVALLGYFGRGKPPVRDAAWFKRFDVAGVKLGMTLAQLDVVYRVPHSPLGNEAWLYEDSPTSLIDQVNYEGSLLTGIFANVLYRDGEPILKRHDSVKQMEAVLGPPTEVFAGQHDYFAGEYQLSVLIEDERIVWFHLGILKATFQS